VGLVVSGSKPIRVWALFRKQMGAKVLSFDCSASRMITYDDDTQIEWLIKEVGNEETARNMIQLAVLIGSTFNYPIPVVTDGKHGKTGVKYDLECNTMMVGFGMAAGSREG
jgi:hypothetical protein